MLLYAFIWNYLTPMQDNIWVVNCIHQCLLWLSVCISLNSANVFLYIYCLSPNKEEWVVGLSYSNNITFHLWWCCCNQWCGYGSRSKWNVSTTLFGRLNKSMRDHNAGKEDVWPRWRKDRMLSWKQGDMFLAEIVLISFVGIRGIYLSLAFGTAKFKQLD